MEQERVDVGLRPAQIQVLAQYVKDFSFENPAPTLSLRPSAERPEIDVNIALDAAKINDQDNDALYETSVTVKVRSLRGGNILFITEISYAALVSLTDVPAAAIKPLLYVDVPQLLFPFVRQKVAEAAQSGGFPPLLLTPVDFRGMYEDAAKRQSAAAATASSVN